ncbi:cupin domain-containing protein [Streptomyces sp.]|uniref:cupin domain-containing protein n=1 Tax=Streptomyces sp. TaxID=1931 RepID=UPI002D52F30D|nr:cupin domain-containing protein [Streptomyces sp.]HZF92284.1 cupin domain-containing protein [Streptomyces sp.]
MSQSTTAHQHDQHGRHDQHSRHDQHGAPHEHAQQPVRDVLHIPAGEGRSVWLSGDVYTVKLTHEESGGSLTFLEASVPPGGGPPLHIHADADEAFYLLSGELDITARGRTYAVRPGDFVFIPKGTPHRFRNNGIHTARQLLLFSPSGVDRFFLEAGSPPVPGTPPPPPETEDLPRVVAIGERHHLFQAAEESR